jgi:hypothetical protein
VNVGGRFKETDPRGAIIGADGIAKGDVQEGEIMAAKGFWAGWVAFAGFVMLIIGTLDSLQGLTALIKDEYYVLAPNRILVVDLTTWGWIMLIWGIVLALAGLGLLGRQGWARWFAIVAVGANFIAQLGFLGGANFTLWGLTVVALNVLVLYALIVRWGEAKEAAPEPGA